VSPGEINENFFEGCLLQMQIANFCTSGEDGLRGGTDQ
jgi:hypothetical protein